MEDLDSVGLLSQLMRLTGAESAGIHDPQGVHYFSMAEPKVTIATRVFGRETRLELAAPDTEPDGLDRAWQLVQVPFPTRVGNS